MNYPRESIFDLETLLDNCAPDRILIVGDQQQLVGKDYEQQRQLIHKPCDVVRINNDITLDHPALKDRYDLAIVTETLESLSQTTSQQLLGRLRDLCSPRLAVIVNLNHCDWQAHDLLAFGLIRINQYPAKDEPTVSDRSDKPVVIYHYNIDSYKKTPDWFNAKNWANPDLWNKFWW